eukprot:TRINITY_DN6496_c0_g1_i13.p1 TRINITY_DN6496_c0_g1~~TRINITY_DN6496_c0_g1_i13.p1  ORF type:complete len:187 (+),score=29.85 TRINITY_DN6496_c0_g1_i13:119-679(+)
MKCSEEHPLRQLNRVAKKRIRKISKPRQHTFKSNLTTLNELSYGGLISGESTASSAFQDPANTPEMISPLKEILTDSRTETGEKAMPLAPVYVSLKGEDGGELQSFRVFREKEVPLFSQEMTDVLLNEPVCDNDWLTDNEQIVSAIESAQNEIRETFSNFKDMIKEARNFKRFCCNKLIINKRRKI